MALRSEDVVPRLGHKWRLEVQGINFAEVKEVDLPDREWDEVIVPNGDRSSKYRAREKVGDLVLRKVVLGDKADLALVAWYEAGDKRAVDVIGLDQADNEIERITYEKCWPKKMPGRKLKKSASEVVMDELTLSVELAQKAAQL